MALVSGYSSDEDEELGQTSAPAPSSSKSGPNRSVQAAPEVSLEVIAIIHIELTSLGPHATETNARKAFRQTTLL